MPRHPRRSSTPRRAAPALRARLAVEPLETRLTPAVPLANPSALSALEDYSAASAVTAHDDDGDTLTFAITTPPAHGLLTAFDPATGTYVYTPAADYFGPDSFTFTAADATDTSAPAEVTITVTPVNDAPTFTAEAARDSRPGGRGP